MTTESAIIYAITSYKICSLLVGLVFGYMGYKLFCAGIFTTSGDLQIQAGNNNINLKKAAPGTFFTVFGAIIISLTIYQGLGFKKSSQPVAPVLPNLEEMENEN